MLHILDKDYFEHFLLLVDAIFILCGTSIMPVQLQRAKQSLISFCCLFEALYDERHMSANLHQLLHLSDVVKELGPLWIYSGFNFEDMNGQLTDLFHGSQNVDKHIMNTIGTILCFPELVDKLKDQSPVHGVYSILVQKGKRVDVTRWIAVKVKKSDLNQKTKVTCNIMSSGTLSIQNGQHFSCEEDVQQ